jgi:hypothetical protein
MGILDVCSVHQLIVLPLSLSFSASPSYFLGLSGSTLLTHLHHCYLLHIYNPHPQPEEKKNIKNSLIRNKETKKHNIL